MEESTLYTEPELYDQVFPRARDSQYMGNEVRRKRMIDSEAFYLDEARYSVGPVLELACGSGRLTIPIAQGGPTSLESICPTPCSKSRGRKPKETMSR